MSRRAALVPVQYTTLLLMAARSRWQISYKTLSSPPNDMNLLPTPLTVTSQRLKTLIYFIDRKKELFITPKELNTVLTT